MDLTPSLFDRGSRLPIQRSRSSFFSPSWDVGRWDDFDRDMDFRGQMRSMQQQVSDMERNMEKMWQRFIRLVPSDLCREFEDWRLESGEPVVREGVVKDDSTKMLRLNFDVRQFKPEEITIKTVDQRLMVHAKHEEASDSSKVYREYQRMFTLPEGVAPESLKSTLTPEGILTLEAPLPSPIEAPKKEVHIPIQHEKSSQ